MMLMKKKRDEPWNLALFLCLVWTVTLLYGEMFAFWVPPLFSCSWPHLPNLSLSSSNFTASQVNEIDGHGDYVKVAVIADPQLMDHTSLHLAPKSLALEIAQFYTDLFMRRVFLSSISPFQPDTVLFLGDYFDGGPTLSDEDYCSLTKAIDHWFDDRWQESLSRFKHIFNLNPTGRMTDVKVYYIPGNHDIGYAAHHFHKPEVLKRYEAEFGTRNHRFTIGKVDFIAIDAQTMDGSSKAASTLRSWDFVNNASRDLGTNSRVLLTHIPLYRPDWTPCGPHRYSEIINQVRIQRYGHDEEIIYQNYLSQESSNRLLSLIRPVLVLSGHDHDQCTVTHMTDNGLVRVREQTVGTISWQQGNLYPSFMLLSVSNSAQSNVSAPEAVISTQLCFLPNQTYIYIWYAILFGMTILGLLLWPTSGINFWHHFSDILGDREKLFDSGLFGSGLKEKDEDENCEYQMVWDAQGSMHLVRVLGKASPASFREKASPERSDGILICTYMLYITCPLFSLSIWYFTISWIESHATQHERQQEGVNSEGGDLRAQHGRRGQGNAQLRPTRRQMNQDQQETMLKLDISTDPCSGSSTGLMPLRQSRSIVKLVVRRVLRMIKLALFIAVVNVTLYMMLLFKDWID
ncbi:hypothetical protein Dimus_011208 [Dionaea muscipula]